jgi:hypothetical protein
MGSKMPGTVEGILMVAIIMPTVNASVSAAIFGLKAPALKSIMMTKFPKYCGGKGTEVSFIN